MLPARSSPLLRSIPGALLLALPCLHACSLFSEDLPQSPTAFGLLPGPLVSCVDPAFVPNCGLLYEGTLTERSTYDLGVPPYKQEYHRLIFDDSLQVFDLTDIPQVQVPMEVGQHYRVVVDLVATVLGGYGSFEARDAEGRVFFGTNEIETDWEFNPDPPVGWQVWMQEGGYGTDVVGCQVRVEPQVRVVEHGGQRIRLVQGAAGGVPGDGAGGPADRLQGDQLS
jgi:hypothetical protein